MRMLLYFCRIQLLMLSLQIGCTRTVSNDITIDSATEPDSNETAGTDADTGTDADSEDAVDSDIDADSDADSATDTSADSETQDDDSDADSAADTDSYNDTNDGTDTLPELSEVLFDDFEYTGSNDAALADMGWYPRSGGGGPGADGCIWSADNITFVEQDGETVMRLMAFTDGSGPGSQQAEICAPEKFWEGTYAARVRFTNDPVTGTVDGDQIVETFFTITSWDMAGMEAYSEVDFEYLANGGWGIMPKIPFYPPRKWMHRWRVFE